MATIPTIAPISHMRIRQAELLQKAKEGPVVLLEKGSKPVGVLVSPEQWNALNNQVRHQALLLEARRIFAEMENEPAKRISHDALRRQLSEKVATR